MSHSGCPESLVHCDYGASESVAGTNPEKSEVVEGQNLRPSPKGLRSYDRAGSGTQAQGSAPMQAGKASAGGPTPR
jgi:hypothetical protein